MTSRVRRRFLQQAAAVGGATLLPGTLLAAGDSRLDLLIHGGELLDPGQNLRGRYDIGIRWGKVVEVAPEIPASSAQHVLDAGGKLVTPGLIDLHTHVYPLGSALGLPADELVPLVTELKSMVKTNFPRGTKLKPMVRVLSPCVV